MYKIALFLVLVASCGFANCSVNIFFQIDEFLNNTIDSVDPHDRLVGAIVWTEEHGNVEGASEVGSQLGELFRLSNDQLCDVTTIVTLKHAANTLFKDQINVHGPLFKSIIYFYGEHFKKCAPRYNYLIEKGFNVNFAPQLKKFVQFEAAFEDTCKEFTPEMRENNTMWAYDCLVEKGSKSAKMFAPIVLGYLKQDNLNKEDMRVVNGEVSGLSMPKLSSILRRIVFDRITMHCQVLGFRFDDLLNYIRYERNLSKMPAILNKNYGMLSVARGECYMLEGQYYDIVQEVANLISSA